MLFSHARIPMKQIDRSCAETGTLGTNARENNWKHTSACYGLGSCVQVYETDWAFPAPGDGEGWAKEGSLRVEALVTAEAAAAAEAEAPEPAAEPQGVVKARL